MRRAQFDQDYSLGVTTASSPTFNVGTIYRNLCGGRDHSQTLIDRVLAKDVPALPPHSHASLAAPTTEKAPGIAITALILGISSVALFGPFTAIPAIICGHLALGQIKKSQTRRGRGMALTGLIAGYAVVLFYVLFITYLATSPRES